VLQTKDKKETGRIIEKHAQNSHQKGASPNVSDGQQEEHFGGKANWTKKGAKGKVDRQYEVRRTALGQTAKMRDGQRPKARSSGHDYEKKKRKTCAWKKSRVSISPPTIKKRKKKKRPLRERRPR